MLRLSVEDGYFVMVKKIRRVTPIVDPGYVPRPTRIRKVSDTVEYRQVERQSSTSTREDRGAAAWRALHTYAGCDREFFLKWEKMIPCGTCRENFKKLLADYPPDFSSPDAFWRWGWFMHNAVNEKLGKPLISLEEATQLWRNNGKVEENRGTD